MILARTNGVADEDFIWDFYILASGCAKGQIGKGP